jgi:ParB-like nuclease domain
LPDDSTTGQNEAGAHDSTPSEPKDNHGWLSIDAIRPSPENEMIYRPVLGDDPEIRALATSIGKYGLQEPIVVTRDGYILSGHRRFAACQLLGMSQVKCRIHDISRSDREFEALLRECNRQRSKSFDEVVREAVVESKPGSAYIELIKHRKATTAVSGEFLSIEGVKTRKGISKGKRRMLDAAIKVIKDQQRYWPLSDRSIHYDLLNDPPLRHSGKPDSWYRNNPDCYGDLCDLLTRARLAGEIPFDAIADPTRTMRTWALNRTPGEFIKVQMASFLTGYFRDYQQSQPNHIEIIGEKNTVEGSIRPVAMEHCIPYTLGRGYCSIEPRHRMSQRFRESGKANLIILILSDFDPEGEDIAHSFVRSMRDDFGITEIIPKKVCLTYEQVLERKLPRTFDIKKTSPRYKKFSAKYGDRVHELEALPSAERSRLLTEAIDEVMDIDAFNREVDAEREDAALIAGLRTKVGPALTGAVE